MTWCAQRDVGLATSMAAAEKDKGNAAFKLGDYKTAIVHFTNALNLEPTHVLYSNRSACYAGLGKWDEALKDAESCIEKSPTWAKVRPAPLPSPHAAARAQCIVSWCRARVGLGSARVCVSLRRRVGGPAGRRAWQTDSR